MLMIICELNLNLLISIFCYVYRFLVIRGEKKLVDSVQDSDIVLPLNISKPRQTNLVYEK